VEILSLGDALHQCCEKSIPIRFPNIQSRRTRMASEQSLTAISHLAGVLRSRSRSCGCLDGYLELTAKEALLRGDKESVSKSILSGWRACEEICGTHAEGRVAPPHRGDSRAGVDV